MRFSTFLRASGRRPLVLAVFFMSTGCSVGWSQNFPVSPATPTDFRTRGVGGGLGSSVVGVTPIPGREVTRTFIAVSELRPFVSAEGKQILAQLLAFEEGEISEVKRPFTLIKEGAVRLLVEGKTKPHVLPLERLSEKDQTFIRQVDAANQAAAGESEGNEKEGDQPEEADTESR